MVVPAVVAYKERGNILQAILDIVAIIAVIYAMYKLFGLFKDFGESLEKKLNELKNTINPTDVPEKFKETGEDIWTIIKGTLTGEQNTPDYNKAMANLHYGGPQWGPGTGLDTSKTSKGIIRKYGQDIKPGETRTFDGGYYTERVVNNLVKAPDSNEYIPKEDALARKYGFSTYAQFNAWLSGVKAAARAAGKDPNKMSLDELVEFGRELEKKKEEWKKQNPQTTPRLETQGDTKRPWMKPLPLEEQDKLNRVVFPRTPGGGVEINYTDVKMTSPQHKPGLLPKPPIRPKPLPHEPRMRILPIRVPVYEE